MDNRIRFTPHSHFSTVLHGAALLITAFLWPCARGAQAQQAAEENAFLFTNAVIVTLDDQDRLFERGYVVVQGDRIVAVGEGEAPSQWQHAQRIDASGKIIMPGLVNGHMHSRPARGFGDGMTEEEWHERVVDPITYGMTREDSYAGCMLGLAESIRSGTTTTALMPALFDGCIEAAQDMGIRARLALHRDEKGYGDYNDTVRYLESHEQHADDRVQVWFTWESYKQPFEESGTRPMYQVVSEAAKTYGTGFHGHLLEILLELEFFSQHFSERPFPMLQRIGLLRKGVSFAHGVWINEEDIAALAKSEATIVHVPVSVSKEGMPITPVRELMDAGVNVSLGTDGLVSSFKVDMFEVMRLAALLQRIRYRDPQALLVRQVLRMATRNGAFGLALEDQIGSLEVGKKADIILLDTEGKPHWSPLIVEGPYSNVYALLVFSAHGSDVDTVLVDGKILLEGGKLRGWRESELMRAAQRSAERLVTATKKD